MAKHVNHPRNPYLAYVSGSEKGHEQVRKTLLKRHPEFRKWTVVVRKRFTVKCLDAIQKQRKEKHNQRKAKLEVRQKGLSESRDESNLPPADQSSSADTDSLLAYVKGSERGYEEVRKSLTKNHPQFRNWTARQQSSFVHKCKGKLEAQRAQDKERNRLEHGKARDTERQAFSAVIANLGAQFTYLSGLETSSKEVKESLLQRHPNFHSWNPAHQKKFANKCMDALQRKCKQLEKCKPKGDEQAMLLEYFPLPYLNDNEPYAACFDGTERSYGQVKKKLQKAFPEFKTSLKTDRAHQIALKCWENIERQHVEQAREKEVSSSTDDPRSGIEDTNHARPGRYIDSSPSESPAAHSPPEEPTLAEASPAGSLRSDHSKPEFLSGESASEDSPGKVTHDEIAAHLEAPLEGMRMLVQRCTAETKNAELKHLQKITELEAENEDVKTENSELKEKMKRLVAYLGTITMAPQVVDSMRSNPNTTPLGYKRQKSASDKVSSESNTGAPDEAGTSQNVSWAFPHFSNRLAEDAFVQSGARSRKRGVSEIAEPAENPTVGKKNKKEKEKEKKEMKEEKEKENEKREENPKKGNKKKKRGRSGDKKVSKDSEG
ncbi:hypothetical protein BKA81DRAFT_186296 [Phyllosticta paracitricarpa]